MNFRTAMISLSASIALALSATPALADHHGDKSMGHDSDTEQGQMMKSEKATTDIISTAEAAGSFTTLLTAIEVAGLTDTLATGGPFTVFAPTDEAFSAIPEADLTALLADKQALTSVLTYHVVDGRVPAAKVVKLDSATTLQGSDVTINVEGDNVEVNKANVTATDIKASNGLIHVIDTVLMPGS